MLLGISGSVFLYNIFDPYQASARRQVKIGVSLKEARDALIGYAASSATRPGQLPCPDMNNDGDAEAPDATGCPSGNIGRVPWRTLGLNDLRDDAGERLWYAPSTVFTRGVINVCCFDNDTRGTLTVSQNLAATVITSEAVAVIFAPGPLVPGQTRSAANANNPVHYLDTTDGVSNAASPAFIAAQTSSTFNDRLLVMDTAHLWTVVEVRVAREMLALFKQYRDSSGCDCYPWAASDFDDDSTDNNRNGMVPIEVALPHTWGSLGITRPSWMIGSDEWGKQFLYAVAGDETEDHTGGTLTLGGVNKDIVIITPGPAGAVCREYSNPPTCNTGYRSTSRLRTNYIEDLPPPFDFDENNDYGQDFDYPPRDKYARDRIYSCPGTPGIC